MKILVVSDEESKALWQYGTKEKLREYDLMLSCGDLNPEYLSYLVTIGRAPLLYVHGNHDANYAKRPPEGCDCIDDKLVVFNGLRILGLGGCRKYHPGPHQYTEKEMRKRIRKLRFHLWRTGGVDIVVAHAPAEGLGDAEDPAHRGFAALRELLDKYKPRYLLHGHVHMCYNINQPRTLQYENTTIINASERYVLEVDEGNYDPKYYGQVVWKNGAPLQFDKWNPLG